MRTDCSGQVLREEFHRDAAIRLLLLRYTQALITQMAPTVVMEARQSLGQASSESPALSR